MNQTKDPDTLIICKTFRTGDMATYMKCDRTLEETINHFFEAFSHYVSFLKERSGFNESDMTTNRKNLFSHSSDTVSAVSLTHAAPVVLFTEAIQSLKRCANISTATSQTNIMALVNMGVMAAKQYANAHSLEILDQHILIWQAILILTPLSYDRSFPLMNLGEALYARFAHTDDISDLNQAIVYYREVRSFRDNQFMEKLGRCIRTRFTRTRSKADLDEAVDILRHMLSDIPCSHPLHVGFQHDLGVLLMAQYEIENRSSILMEAISVFHEALESCSETENFGNKCALAYNVARAMIKGHELGAVKIKVKHVIDIFQLLPSLGHDSHNEENRSLSNILTGLLRMIRNNLRIDSRLQDYEDINEAIAVVRGILPNDGLGEVAHLAEYKWTLAHLLSKRFLLSKADEDAQEIIEIYRDILTYTDLNIRALVMKDYADFLGFRLKHREQALLLYEDALQNVSGDEADTFIKFELLINMTSVLLLHVGNNEEQEEQFGYNIDEAINRLKMAISLPGCDSHPQFPEVKRRLSTYLLMHSRHRNDVDDFNDSVELVKDDDDSNDILIPYLQNTMGLHVEKIRKANTREELILRLRRSLEAQPSPHPSRIQTLTSLGVGLLSHFKLGGPRKLLDEAILHLREAISLSPTSMDAMVSLACVLWQKSVVAKYEQFTRHDDYLEEVVDLVLQCIPLLPEHIGSSVKNHVGQIQTKLVLGETDVSDSVLSILDRFMSRDNDSFEAAMNVSSVYWMKFEQSRDIKHLDESILHNRQASILCPDGDPHNAVISHDLGHKLINRYDISNNKEDLDEGLISYIRSIQTLSQGSSYRSFYNAELGMTLAKWLVSLGEESDQYMTVINAILEIFRTGAVDSPASPVTARFYAARLWAGMADISNSDSALDAYQQAINLLPRLSSMATNITSRQGAFRIERIDGLGRNAAIFAIRLGKYDKAVEFLEAGRAVFWQQVLQLRSPMEKLGDEYPDLYFKLSAISAELQKASSHMNVSPVHSSNEEKRIKDEELFRLEELNEEWQRTLDDIRKLKGFDDFLLPQCLPKLQASVECPVIFLIPDKLQSHALIMFAEKVLYVNLPNAAYERLQRLVSKMPGVGSYASMGQLRGVIDDLLSEIALRHEDESAEDQRYERKGAPKHFKNIDMEDEIKYVLEELWKVVFSPLIHELKAYMKAESLLNICWCPSGIFSFLPLHAAGIYRNDMSSVECVFDYVISSYTPTVGALSHRADRTGTPDDFKMMVVVDPNLPSTAKEMEAIERHVKNDCLVLMGTKESPAFVEKVASNLSDISIAHFACHGVQNEEPLDSCLILHDGNLKMSRIMGERMPNAALAFLCACQTAMGDKHLPDEAMHLGATLLYSGFRSVVATMWSIDDADGPLVADNFYAHLFKHNPRRPNTSLSAEAIHYAITALRSKGVGFMRWVPFIHLGA